VDLLRSSAKSLAFAGLGLGLLAVPALAAPAHAVTATIPVGTGATAPWALAVDSSTGTLYATVVAYGGAGTVSVINESTDALTATIGVGLFPMAMGVDAATHRLYVTSVSGTVTVITEVTNTVIDTIAVGRHTTGVAVDPISDTIYATNMDDNTVSVINGATDMVTATITVGSFPGAVAVDPTTHTAYVANLGSGGPGTVSVINGSTKLVTASIGVGPDPAGVAVNPTTHAVYVNNNGIPSSLSVIDGTAHTVIATLSSVHASGDLAVDSASNTIYAATDSTNVTIVDGATNSLSATLLVGSGPLGVAVDSTTHAAYVANNYGGSISVIDGSSSGGGGAGGAGGNVPHRLAGSDRFGTAVAASRLGFPTGNAGGVVLARADDYADALVAAPLAAAKHAPLLLTSGASLPATTQAELQRVLAPGATVYLLGGPAAIPTSVQTELNTLGYQTVRFQGANRYATAVAVAGALGDPGTVLLTTGVNFPDGLAAGPAAAHIGAAVLLTEGATMPAETQGYLTAHATTAYALGGPAVTADPTATAVQGADRYATAAAIAAKFFAAPTTAGVATGANFPDALAGGALLAYTGGPLLLTDPARLSAATIAYLVANPTATAVDLFGSTTAISAGVEAALRTAMNP
jgi:YVTN family beta-propeller protein